MAKLVNNKIQQDKETYHKWIIFPIIFAIAIIPLILRAYFFDPNLSQFSWYSTETSKTDIFLYYKLVAIMVTCVYMLGVILYQVASKKIDMKKLKTAYFIPLAIYAVLSLVSSVFSKYSYFSYHGMAESFETIWVLISYCVIAYYTYLYIDSELATHKLMKGVFCGIVTITIIGVLQFLHFDIFRTNIIKKLITPSSLWGSLDEFTFNFPLGRVYSTLYNPNYVGVYASMIIPIAFVLLILQMKEWKKILLYVAIIIGQTICFTGSGSKTALISLSLNFIFTILLVRKQIWQYRKICIPIGVVLFAGVGMLISLKGKTFITIMESQFHPEKVINNLEEVQTNDNNVTIKYKKQTLVLTMVSDGQNCTLTFCDEQGKAVDYAQNTETERYDFTDERYSDLSFEVASSDNIAYAGVLIDGNMWYFTNMSDDGTYYYRNIYGKLVKVVPAETSIFNNNPGFASGRGYIWSKSLPLLKDHILLGTGADTFQIVFPQYDYVGLRNAGYVDALIGKAHNMYIQMAVQTGVLSLVGFLTFYLIYMVSSIRLYWNSKLNSYMSQLGVALLAGTFGYMISGLTNDSTPSVAPVFWVLIGLGLAVNYQVRSRTKKEE